MSTMNKEKLEIREDPVTKMIYVQNAKSKPLSTQEEALETFEKGITSRKTHFTEMNDHSSRSHLIFGVIIKTKNNKTGQVSKSKISFVDLAGSERIKQSNPGMNNERIKESNAINLSLKTLGDVIHNLSDENSKAVTPYRDNKLTLLMKDSLGGNSKTLMFVNISPAEKSSSETQLSLNFGTRVKMVQNNATKNVESLKLQQLKMENDSLRKQLQ